MKPIKIKHKGDRGELIFYSILIALPLLQICIFYFYVNFNSILLSFQDYSVKKDKFYFVGGDQFKDIWSDLTSGSQSYLLPALKNSIVVWFFTSGLGTFLAILFAYYIYKKWWIAKTFKFFLFLPSVLPSVLFVGVYEYFMKDAVPGYLGEVLGIKVQPLLTGYSSVLPGVLFFNVFVCFGTQLLIYTGAMDQISPDVIEAGQVDGVSSSREFFSIVLPMILPTISTFIIASVATVFTNQANLFAFFGSSGTNLAKEDYTIGYYLFMMVERDGEKAYSYASALGIICTLIAFPLTMGVRRLLNRGEEK